ncbi:MAG: glycoside hydrolase family 127 protein [Planctomycetales bacterium]|nr:glycoside hydrolase family 127 protein [Planctomycetales bacterium]
MNTRWTLTLALLVSHCAGVAHAADADYPIRPVPFTQVTVEDVFWAPRIETNRVTTVWYDFGKCEETGRIDNFSVAGGLKQGGFQGIFFNDSDVVKVMEGAAYSLAVRPDSKLDRYLDELIAKIAAAQEDDGYLYTARTINDPQYDFPGKAEGRWSHLKHSHELYNVGHMYEAAVAHWQATGKRNFLDVAIKNADLVCRVFGPGEGQRVDVPGHEEIEIGLVRLFRATGDEKYLRQAKFFIDMRGRRDKRKELYGMYAQDHRPIVEQSEAVGHAVRAAYLYAGTADVAALTGDKAYIDAVDRIWENIVARKMHVTGGIGATAHGEAFGEDYDLPNEMAYLETCAAISAAMFHHRMFLLHGDAKYVDALERVVYNGFLSGVSLSGDRFFYPNPLACDGRSKFNQGTLGRSPWFGCSCCPVNVVRFIPSIPGYVYAVRDDSIYVNLYVGGKAIITAGEHSTTLTQQTRYPHDGAVRIIVDPQDSAAFALRLRIPGWAQGRPTSGDLYRYVDSHSSPYVVKVNGQAVQPELEKGFAVLRRTWRPGDVVELELPMPIRRVLAHENVAADRGRVALERGPLVYCLEATDNDGSVYDVVLPDDAKLESQFQPRLLGGATVLSGTASRRVRQADGSTGLIAAPIRAVPYYAWAHRNLGEMAVWLARDPEAARVKAAPTLASTARATASHCWEADTVEALHDQVDPRSSDDHDVARHTWWNHRGGTEWAQYDFAQAAEVSAVEVYWFDDTGRGQCRVPKSWRLLYRSDDQWKPVAAMSAYGAAKDTFNKVRFTPVLTDGLRLEVELQPEFSGGILEWKAH